MKHTLVLVTLLLSVSSVMAQEEGPCKSYFEACQKSLSTPEAAPISAAVESDSTKMEDRHPMMACMKKAISDDLNGTDAAKKEQAQACQKASTSHISHRVGGRRHQ